MRNKKDLIKASWEENLEEGYSTRSKVSDVVMAVVIGVVIAVVISFIY